LPNSSGAGLYRSEYEVGHRLEERPQLGLRGPESILGTLALGDVGHRPRHAQRGAALVALGYAPSDAVDVIARRTPEAELLAVLDPALEVGSDGIQGPLAVLRME
jgi:hypothetical protein